MFACDDVKLFDKTKRVKLIFVKSEKNVARVENHRNTKGMATKKELKSRLKALGKDRAWLAVQTFYRISTINKAFAPNLKTKINPVVLARIEQAIGNEEERVQAASLKQAAKLIADA
jgi:hypothetical protein